MKVLRLQKIQSLLKRPVLIKKKENLFYLTGKNFDHRAEEYLLVTKNRVVGFGSGLEHIDWIRQSDQLRNISKYIQPHATLDIEYAFTYGEGKYLQYKLPGRKVVPAVSPLSLLRQVKDADELQNIRHSMEIVEKVFIRVKQQLAKKTWTEAALARYITECGYKLGAEDVSFPAIVASGRNGAVPHHVPGTKKLQPGEAIIIDFGFKYKNYCSDFTRTVFINSAPKKLADAYIQTEKAYNASIDCITTAQRPVSAGAVYDLSVQILAEKKLDRFFIHSLGHGTGLEIHELPNLSPGSKEKIVDGMVFSIEPGVYFPKVGGIRIEDLVYMQNGQCKKFINVSTKLEDNIII